MFQFLKNLHPTIGESPHAARAIRRSKAIKSLKAKIDARRAFSEKLADWLTTSFGTVAFLVLNGLFFAIWIWLNTAPGFAHFDPYPFGFLTMVVSLEAIFLAIIVLISQNRQARVSELREEIDLYINTYAESEITKLLHLVAQLAEKQGIELGSDKELQHMLKRLESDQLEEALEKQL